jgi:hypothetical protein
MSTPPIFDPIHLRNGVKYRCLTQYSFSVVEKEWICRQFSTGCEVIPNDNKVSNLHIVFNRRLEAFSKRYGLCLVTLNEWINYFHRGDELIAGPCVSMFKSISLDAIGLARVQSFITNHPNGWDVNDFVDMFKTQMAQSAARLVLL